MKVGDFVARKAKNALFADLTFAKKLVAVENVYLRKQKRTIKVVKLEGQTDFIDMDYVRLTTEKEITENDLVRNSISYIQELEDIEGLDPCVSSFSGNPKMGYKDETEAYKAAFALIKRDVKGAMIIYSCPKCNQIHIGRKIEQ